MASRPTPSKRRLLTVIGAINWDVSIFEDRFARPGEEVPVRSVEEYSGGKGANTAVAASRVLGRGRVALVGALGDDAISAAQLSGLREEGVTVDGVVRLRGRASGRAYIVVDRIGRKTIHTHFGANAALLPRHISTGGARRTLAGSSMVILMDPPSQTALGAAKVAVALGARLIYSPGVRTFEGLRGIGKVIDFADLLVVDSNELKNLCRTSDEDAAIDTLSRSFPRLTTVATLGPRGCVVAAHGRVTRVKGVNLESLGLKAVNSTGSGDAFLGVLASHLILGDDVPQAVEWANLAGALKATKRDTRGSPGAMELESYMKVLRRVRG